MSLIRTVFLFVLLSLLTLSTAISSDKVRLIIRGDDLGAFAQKGLGGGPADALGGGSDEGPFSGQTSTHVLFL